MADSDGEYNPNASDDDMQLDGVADGYNTRRNRRDGGRGGGGERARQAWESRIQDRVGAGILREGADGTIAGSLEMELQGRKRKRLRQDTQPFQRGIIRHLLLVLDLSESMLEKDFRPSRFHAVLMYAQQYVREFFEQNPISQLSVLAMHDGLCVRLSELSGNPNDHISMLQELRARRTEARQGGEKLDALKEPRGSPSLQNALDMARAGLFHTPSHGTREVVIVLGALLSLDPGDIYQTIRACIRDRVKVGVIGMSGRLKICQEIVAKTNSGDDSGYVVALDQQHFKELLMSTTTPPVIRSSEIPLTATGIMNGQTTSRAAPASLLQMGFPSRFIEQHPTLCACHGYITRGGYSCSRCMAKVCSLPATCPSCRMTLILSTHLARSYHHLFPLKNWRPVSWKAARAKGSRECRGCMTEFPAWPDEPDGANMTTTDEGEGEGSGGAVGGGGKRRADESSASESSRYECETCRNHFCIDCDLFCHEVVHNCPGCLGQVLQ